MTAATVTFEGSPMRPNGTSAVATALAQGSHGLLVAVVSFGVTLRVRPITMRQPSGNLNQLAAQLSGFRALRE